MSFPNSQGATFSDGQFNNITGDVMSFFSNSHGATFYDGQFNNVAGNQYNNSNNTYSTVNVSSSAQTALQTLWQAIADVGAAHNSEARYPQPRCHPETREEVRRLFIDWVRLWKRTWWVYWLYGPAGAGKSAVAQSISEECHRTGDLVSSFFHSRNHPKRNNPTYLFLTVAYGLACTIPELQEPIKQAIHRNPAILQGSIEDQFVELVAKPCRWLTRREEWGSRPRLVIIDGLDECEGGHNQRRILQTIASSVRESEGLPLQFLICSRPEPAIREFFDTKPFHPLHWYYPLDDDNSTYRDILVVLQDGFAKIRADVKFNSIRFPAVWPSPDDVHTIARKACGQFVYVAVLLSWIAEGSISPCTALEIVLGLVPNIDGDSPFEELDVLYRYILSTHPEPQLKKVMKILALILHVNKFTRHEFSLEDVEVLLNLSSGEAALALRGLHSVLNITDNGKIIVRHASFTDFLTHPSRSRTFFLDSEYYKSFAASCFIRHLKCLLGDKRFLDLIKHIKWSDSLARIVWTKWTCTCTATNLNNPTEDLLFELRTLNWDISLSIIDTNIHNSGGIWAVWLSDFISQAFDIVEWLECLPVRHQDLVCRFRLASAGFHLSIHDEDIPLVLDAVLGLLAGYWIELSNNDGQCLIEQSLGFLEEYGFSRLRAEVKVISTTQCSNCGQCAVHDLHMSEHWALTPVKCSPGVVFVRLQHIIPHLITVIGHEGVIEALCFPYYLCVQEVSLLGLARQLLPGFLLPLLEPVVPNILNHKGWRRNAMVWELVDWLKSLLLDPEYHSKTVSLAQQVRDWAIHTQSLSDGDSLYKRICDRLDSGTQMDPETNLDLT